MKLSATQTAALRYIADNSGHGVTVANRAAPIASVLVLEAAGLVTLEREETRVSHKSAVYATLTPAGRAAL